jgi:hypothetical protein
MSQVCSSFCGTISQLAQSSSFSITRNFRVKRGHGGARNFGPRFHSAYLNEAVANLDSFSDIRKQGHQIIKEDLVGAVSHAYPNNSRSAGGAPHLNRKIFIFCDNDQLVCGCVVPNRFILGFSQTHLANRLGWMPGVCQGSRQGSGQLGIDDETHRLRRFKDCVISLSCGELQARADVLGLQIGKVF